MLGVGAICGYLGGNEESVEALRSCLNKTISTVVIEKDDNRHIEDAIVITFSDGTQLRAWDNGRSCCESRYITTDDDLTQFSGASLVGIEVESAPNRDTDGDSHEVQFLRIKTDRKTLVLETHNEHNGYYGGFDVQLRLGQ